MSDRERERAAIEEATAHFRRFPLEMAPSEGGPERAQAARIGLELFQLAQRMSHNDRNVADEAFTRFDEIVLDLVKGKYTHKRPGAKRTTRPRNIQICIAVMMMIERGFPETQNETSEVMTACRIVSLALANVGIRLSEKSVQNIFAREKASGL